MYVISVQSLLAYGQLDKSKIWPDEIKKIIIVMYGEKKRQISVDIGSFTYLKMYLTNI